MRAVRYAYLGAAIALCAGTGCGLEEGAEGGEVAGERAAQSGEKSAFTAAMDAAEEQQKALAGYASVGSWLAGTRYVPYAKIDAAKNAIVQINEHLRKAQTLLTEARTKHRASPKAATEFARSDYERYNALLPKLDSMSIVYNAEYILRAFSPYVLIRDQDVQPVQLWDFDFAKGLVHDCRRAGERGIVVHRNPLTGEIVWKSAPYRHSIAVVGENADGTPIYETAEHKSVSSAYDPEERAWVKYVGSREEIAAASVYDEAAGVVRHKEAQEDRHGICGVYNPAKGAVEWQGDGIDDAETAGRRDWGCAGYYNPETRSVEWVWRHYGGAACIWSIDGDFHTSNGNWGFHYDPN
ncbi:MAG: hypothetical protein IT371_05790 [Deltaproteobacteria bacterium]|nr:hypothetical protein [Deltaproteobacteria bacterium]